MLRKLLITLALLATCPLYAAEWDLGPARVEVEVDATLVDEAVPFFPVYLSTMPAGFWTALAAIGDTTGESIRATTGDGDTQVACYVHSINTGTETGVVFVRATGLSTSTNTPYYIYLGDDTFTTPATGSTYGRDAVFDGYAALYFPGDSTADLTGNGYDLTAVNSPGTAASDIEGVTAATYTAASSQYHYATGTIGISGWPANIEAMGGLATTGALRYICGLSVAAASSNVLGARILSVNRMSAYIQGNGGSASEPSLTTPTLSADTTYLFTVNRDDGSGTSRVYLDTDTGTNTTTINAPTDFDRFTIGALLYNGGVLAPFNGEILFASVSDVVRSANFIATTNNAWTDASFYVAGTLESEPAGDGDTELQEFTVASQTGTDTIWLNPSNATTSLATAATSDIPEFDQLSRFLNITNASAALSEVSGTIDGIEVEISATGNDVSSDELTDNVIKLIIGGVASGTNKAVATQWTDTSIITRTYGGPTDKWGLTPTDTQIKATDFGVSMQFINIGGSGNALMSVYRVRVRIYYTPPGGGGGESASAFFAFFD